MGLDDKNRPLYMISIAAELAGVHPQTLRSYEQKGLVTPRRTSGNTRMYSQAARVRRLADRVRELETRTPVGAIVRVTPTRRLP